MRKGIISIFFIALSLQVPAQENRSKNLIIVTLDGLRWQEIFTGADPEILSQEKFIADKTVVEKFWDPSVFSRREKLMPFFWGTIARQGQLHGNRYYGNNVNCDNPHWFSYPGYSEMLVGFVDRRVKSNDPIEDPSRTVLDYIESQPGFQGRVATFATWNIIGNIACDKERGFQVNVGRQHAEGDISETETLLNELQELMPSPHGERFDAFTFYYAFEYLKRSCPRVMFISFDETDEHAHGGRYDEYLKAAHKTDKMIAKLWHWIQSQGDYKDRTTLIITTDHGRGKGVTHSWQKHGRLAFGSGQVWVAVIGPDTPPLGELRSESQLYQKQIAKTAAAFLGINYTNVKPVGDIIEPMFVTPPFRSADPMQNNLNSQTRISRK
jgi:hypothetical protein